MLSLLSSVCLSWFTMEEETIQGLACRVEERWRRVDGVEFWGLEREKEPWICSLEW